ncbi:hypothetical protein AAFC00_001650 [Neodothiora populina]|uniref:Uncharacterized protein n=1 Tax=Neodothiora populina TaxID=2781224 RepID=A0ABR3PQT7_9PEZI
MAPSVLDRSPSIVGDHEQLLRVPSETLLSGKASLPKSCTRQPSSGSLLSQHSPLNLSLTSLEDVSDLPSSQCDNGTKHHEPLSSDDTGGKHTTSASVGRVDTWWIWEIACLLLSTACFITIAVVSKIHDGQEISTWTFYLSLNTLVSSLGTAARTSMLLAISAALGQGKWNWFSRRSAKLSTFDLLDSASRGPLGSLLLLFHLRGYHLLSLGAAVTVLSLAIEPMFQAVMITVGETKQLGHGSGLASIHTTSRFDGGGEYVPSTSGIYTVSHTPSVTIWPDLGVKSAIYQGLYAYQNNDNSSFITYSCLTGSCTWPIFVTLGICSSCHDLSNI